LDQCCGPSGDAAVGAIYTDEYLMINLNLKDF
jgi:hypothetical protein